MKALSHVTQKNANYSLVNSVHSQNTMNENILNSDNKSRFEAVIKQSEKNKSIIMGVYNSVIKQILHPKIENEENMKSIFTLLSQYISEFLNNKMPNYTINLPNETSYPDFNNINIKINVNDETRHLLSQHIKQLQEFRQNQRIGYQYSTQQQNQEPHFRMQQFNNTYAQAQGVGMYNTKNWPRSDNSVATQVPTLQQITLDQSLHTGFLQAVPRPKGQTRRPHSFRDFSGNNKNYNNQRQHPYRNQIQDLARPPRAQSHYDSNNNVIALHQEQQLQQQQNEMKRNNNWQQQDAAGLKQYIMPHN
ncbi:unnamed protein product [Parnassius mnemosyne]|uniref:Uncharacterized protein n=1 Tax=Parnassius mnemosyne TaxID=213953 RepID=A0AAV1KDV7_9NEOP